MACPMFSALWAIANQEAGAPLGQAAPYVYSLPAGAVTDIVPVGSKTNVTASIEDSARHHQIQRQRNSGRLREGQVRQRDLGLSG